MSHDKTFRACLNVVAASCKMTRRAQQMALNVSEFSKLDTSPVTAADFAVQALVTRTLGKLYKDVVIVAEEDSAELKTKNSLLNNICEMVSLDWPTVSSKKIIDTIEVGNHEIQRDSFWTLDPIDGTKGFIRGAQYAIALAFIDEGEVTKAIMGCPNLSHSPAQSPHTVNPRGSIFFSQKGAGAWVLPDDFDEFAPKRISCNIRESDKIRICGSVEPLHSVTHKNDQIAKFLAKTNDKLKIDSQCKYAVVGRGQADAFIRLPTDPNYLEKVWDHAAGALIASESGAVVTDADGETLNFSDGKEMSGNKGIVCATPSYHPQIIKAIKELQLNK